MSTPPNRPAPVVAGVKLRGAEKMARIPVKFEATSVMPRKPKWIRTRLGNATEVERIKKTLREQDLHTVCEEASCPNLSECFSKGTATFMIMGDICTRRCPFCDVAHGRPNALDENEPAKLAKTIAAMKLKYVVITSVDRDDLKDGGAAHFAACIRESRIASPQLKIEVLVPDFRGRMDPALAIFKDTPPDVFNHLRAHQVDMLTLGQYLQPSKNHLPVEAFIHPDEFDRLRVVGEKMGFAHVASGPMVRSSYHADQQADDILASAE